MVARDTRYADSGAPGGRRTGGAPLDRRFTADDLPDLRVLLATHLRELGLDADRAAELVIAANELASNAVRYGGGRGRLRLWLDGAVLRCEVSDGGPGFTGTDRAGLVRPDVTAGGGRGLWLVRQVCDEVTITSTRAGTVVTVGVATEPAHRRGRRHGGQRSHTVDGSRTASRSLPG